MRIKEFIARLQFIEATVGNIPVKCCVPGCGRDWGVEDVSKDLIRVDSSFDDPTVTVHIGY